MTTFSLNSGTSGSAGSSGSQGTSGPPKSSSGSSGSAGTAGSAGQQQKTKTIAFFQHEINLLVDLLMATGGGKYQWLINKIGPKDDHCCF